MVNYVALDVETANADWASICQIGIAEFGPDGVRKRGTFAQYPFADGVEREDFASVFWEEQLHAVKPK